VGRERRRELDEKRDTPTRFLAARVLPILRDSLGVFVRKEVEISQARIVIALRRYEVRKHALPERLDELVPEFLEEIPPDPVAGTPMRYGRISAHRSLVWAIGSDEIDGGGVGPASPWERRNGIGDDLWDDSQPCPALEIHGLEGPDQHA